MRDEHATWRGARERGLMDMGDLRGLATVLCMVGFLSVAFWAYGSRRKQRFEEAANLPFADEGEKSSAERLP